MSEKKCEYISPDSMTDLLTGLLERHEVDAVINHVRACPDCESHLLDAVKRFEKHRARPAPVRNEAGRWVDANTPATARRAIRSARSIWAGFAAAAAVLAMAALLVWYPSPHSRPDLPAFWIPAGRELLSLRDQGAIDSRFRDGIDAYDRRALDVAIPLLEQADVGDTYDVLRRIYLASSLGLAGRYPESLFLIDSLKDHPLPKPWHDEARWIRCIALFGSDREEPARELLEELEELRGDIGERARAYASSRYREDPTSTKPPQ